MTNTRAIHLPERLTTMYRFYDGDDVLLYVGITGHPMHRLANHAADKLWWSYVVRATFEHLPSRSAALRAEAKAMALERPLFNVQGNPNPGARDKWEAWEAEQDRRAVAAYRQLLSLGDRL